MFTKYIKIDYDLFAYIQYQNYICVQRLLQLQMNVRTTLISKGTITTAKINVTLLDLSTSFYLTLQC